jgi:hypothetical protein
VSTAKFDYWMNSDNVLQSTILNVYSTTSTTQQTISQTGSTPNQGANFYDLSGVTLTVTPVSTTSRFLIFGKLAVGCSVDNNYNIHGRMLRNGSEIGSGLRMAASGEQGVEPWQAMWMVRQWTGASPYQIPFSYIDSPATTSSVTYKMQALQTNVGINVYLNRANEAGWQSGDTSSITVMEIQA